MKVLVTGGAGFIGSHVVDLLVSAGHQVTVIDDLSTGRRENVNPKAELVKADICSPEIGPVFERGKFSVVSHHAAQISVSNSVKDPANDAKINILGVLNVLEQCVANRVGRVVFASSGGTVYGATDKLPAKESLPFAAVSPYGVSKVATELYLNVYREQHGLRFTSLRYANVYGPRQDPHGEAGVVAIFTERMIRGDEVTVFGDGEYMRDYVYVGDVARANLKALTSECDGPFNVGTGVRTSTNRLFAELKRATGYRGEAKHGPPRAGDLRDSCLDFAKAREALSWSPEVTLSEGLAKTVAWFREKPSSSK